MPKVFESLGLGAIQVLDFKTVAGHALRSLVCNILTRNPERETRTASIIK